MLLKTLLKIKIDKGQNNIRCLLNIYQIFGKVNHLTIKFHGTRNNLLHVLPGNEEDLGHENIGKTYLLYQDQSAKCKEIMRPWLQTSLPKTGVSIDFL